MKDFFKAGFYRLMFQGFNFLAGLFIAAISGAEVFGTISLMIVNAAFLHLLTGLGADQAIVWHGAAKKFQPNKLFTFTFFTALFQVLLFLFITIIFFYTTGKTLLSKNLSVNYFYYELIYFTGLVLLDKYVSLLYAEHRAGICSLLLTVVTGAALLVLIAVRFHFFSITIDPFIFFCLLVLAQAIAVLLLFHSKTKVFFTAFTRHDIDSFFRFSIVVFVTNIIQFIAYRADFWLIDYFSYSKDQLGIYAQANRFAGLLWIAPNIIAALLAPLISRPGSNFKENELAGITRMFNCINLAAAGLIIFISFVIYTVFLQPVYFYGFTSLLYMLPGFYFFSITLLLAAYFSAKNLLWINLAASSICFVIIITADFLLIPGWGIKGAAIANTIAYTLSSLFTIIMFLRVSNLGIAGLFSFQKSDWKLITKLQS